MDTNVIYIEYIECRLLYSIVIKPCNVLPALFYETHRM